MFCFLLLSHISLAEEEIKSESDVVEAMEVSVPPKGGKNIILILFEFGCLCALLMLE